MKYQTEDPKWVTFYPKLNSGFYIKKAGYFDERPEVVTSATQLLFLICLPFLTYQSPLFIALLPLALFGWGKLYINLPIKTGIQDCDSAAWGLNYHDNTIWFYIGGGGNLQGGRKWKTIKMPWHLEWIRTSILMKDGWLHETKKSRVDYSEASYNWINKNKWQETYPYIDSYDNTTVNATIGVSEREWRPLGLKWTKLFAKVRRTIDVSFDQEVGKEKGSWKGGVLGCGYDLLPNETPLECLKRMENERKF